MCGKLISILLICLFTFYLLIAPVNAQNTAIKFYKFEEGIDLAKSTGKPIAILRDDYLKGLDEKAKSEINNNFINIIVPSYASAYGSSEVGDIVGTIILGNEHTWPIYSAALLRILDSNGRLITSVHASYRVDDPYLESVPVIIQMDADNKEARRIEVPRKGFDIGKITEYKKFNDFLYEIYKYAENKKGKIQMPIRPQELGLISVKDLSRETNVTYVTISGFIRDIKSSGNSYSFAIDDGTGVTNLQYNGGLGDIKEGDKIFVKMLWGAGRPYSIITVSKDKIPTKVNPPSSDGSTSAATKTPGFKIVIGAVAIFFVSRKIMKRR